MHDFLSHDGARLLAQRIRQYWLEQGYPGIQTKLDAVDIQNVKLGGEAILYCVRSNIGPDGFPPKHIAMAA